MADSDSSFDGDSASASSPPGASDETTDRLAAVRAVDVDENRLVSLALPSDGSLGAALEDVEEDHAEAEYLDDAAASRVVEALGAVRHHLNG